MRFSIVIPVYRTERFLPRCLDSLVAQTDGDFEAIVVDDASPSGSCRRGVLAASSRMGDSISDAARCRVYGDAAGTPRLQAAEIVARYDARFRCVRHEKNRSAFQARCTGVAAAKGDYIVPVDPDDYLLPETLAKLREVIERETPDLVSYRMEYDNGKKVWPHWCHHPNAAMSGVEALRELTEHKYFTGVASKAFRRETLLSALRELNAPDDFYANTCDDFLMLVPMLTKCEKVAFLDFAGYRYFVNEESASFSWKTLGGFLRAYWQTRQVGKLILRMGREVGVSPVVRELAAVAVLGVERWFVQNALQGMRLSVRDFLRCHKS